MAVKPRVAFILDIRRGNLLEHLLYKALFEMSHDRADFLSRLFSRERPAGLTDESPVVDTSSRRTSGPNRAWTCTKQNARDVLDKLTNEHHFPLDDEDVVAIRSIYLRAFFTGGPNLNYAFGGGNGGAVAPSYRDLMLSEDSSGTNWSYLASEKSFEAVRALELKNLIVPVVEISRVRRRSAASATTSASMAPPCRCSTCRTSRIISSTTTGGTSSAKTWRHSQSAAGAPSSSVAVGPHPYHTREYWQASRRASGRCCRTFGGA